jgi:hypothetical protein
VARRPARLVALAAAFVALAVGATACSSISELLELQERIEREGYRVGDVFHDDFGGSRNEVQIDASTNRGLEPPEGQEEIAGIVWETYPRRFDSVSVTLDDDVATFSRGQLQERFGLRAARLDEREFSDDVSGAIRSAAIAGLIGLVVIVAGAIAIVVAVRRRRRRRGPPAPPPPPGSGPGAGWTPPPPPPGPPPGWVPPPGTGSGYPPPRA